MATAARTTEGRRRRGARVRVLGLGRREGCRVRVLRGGGARRKEAEDEIADCIGELRSEIKGARRRGLYSGKRGDLVTGGGRWF